MTTNTLDGFNTLRAEALVEKKALTDRKVELRRSGLALAGKLEDLQDLNVRWYGQAKRAFPEGTEFGDLIRSQIPTFSDGGTPDTITPTPTP